MVFSIIAEAASASFGPRNVEEELHRQKVARHLKEERMKVAVARAVAEQQLLEKAKENDAPQKGGWFGFGSSTKSPAAAKPAEPAAPAKPAAAAAAPAAAAPAEPAAAEPAAAALDMPAGNATQGASIFKAKCATCHTNNDGGPHKQGPNLFGVIDRPIGGVAGFGYTPATKGYGSNWTNENMFEFLANPKKFIKGTNMAFPGFKKEQDRADVVAYLNTLV